MKENEKKNIIRNYKNRCDCSEDDNCGCSYPNNTNSDYDAVCPKNLNQEDCCKKRSASKKA